MMKIDRKRAAALGVIAFVVTAAMLVILPSTPALSLTGEDVLSKMSSEHRAGYLAGSVEMAALLAGANGDTDRADCITRWYFDEGGTRQIVAALERYKDREALPVVYALIERTCGE